MPKKGTVVLVPFPFTNLRGAKVRPAVVVSSFRTGDDVVVAFVTSRPSKQKATSVVLKMQDVGFAQTGLKYDSAILCAKLATLEKSVLLGELGTLSKETMQKVDECLRKVFGM